MLEKWCIWKQTEETTLHFICVIKFAHCWMVKFLTKSNDGITYCEKKQKHSELKRQSQKPNCFL